MNKQMTLEDLAAMIAQGFEDTATKEDLKNLEISTKADFKGLEKDIAHLDQGQEDIKLRLDNTALGLK